jgi:hypothetical protein
MRGHRTVTDYRGVTALTAFEVFEFLGTQWLIVAKIDKDEITTGHYRRHSKYYRDRLASLCRDSAQPPSRTPGPLPGSPSLRVDMDEFLKADKNELLETRGISTCTALIAALPKRFGYLAHISPRDRVYNGDATNILSQITRKINNFDILASERRNVSFIVVAPRLDSLGNIIDQIIDDGFFLSQIRLAVNPGAREALVVYDYVNDTLGTTWLLDKDAGRVDHGIEDTIAVGSVVEAIMDKDQ